MSNNQNVDELGNPYNEDMGQSNESIGQDEQVNMSEESSSNWEDQARYFQSEKDKLQSENQKLKQYEEVGKFLESRPDIVETIKSQVDGQPNAQSQIELKPDEFDPWEAYNDPTSQSYKYRMNEMQHTINNAVSQATQGIRKETGVNQLRNELSSKGLTASEVDEFMNFADKHPSEYGLENVIKMWRAVSQVPAQSNDNNPLDQIRNVQSQPQAGGVLQGQRPQSPKSDSDAMWDAIKSAGDKNTF